MIDATEINGMIRQEIRRQVREHANKEEKTGVPAPAKGDGSNSEINQH